MSRASNGGPPGVVLYTSAGCDTCNHNRIPRAATRFMSCSIFRTTFGKWIVEPKTGSEVRPSRRAEGLKGLRDSALKSVLRDSTCMRSSRKLSKSKR